MKKFEILNANTLKIIALISMVIDHIGFMLYPNVLWLRCLGRISLPIYAYMIAEGCRHTRNPKQYFLRIFILGALCQAVYFFAYKSLYLSTLISFSLSVAMIFFIKRILKPKDTRDRILYIFFAVLILGVVAVCLYPPAFLDSLRILLDYGIYPFLIPIVLYFLPNKWWRFLAMIPLLSLLTLSFDWEQWLAFAAIPILMLYGGRKGKRNLKYFFYIAYPAHILLIFGIYTLFFS